MSSIFVLFFWNFISWHWDNFGFILWLDLTERYIYARRYDMDIFFIRTWIWIRHESLEFLSGLGCITNFWFFLHQMNHSSFGTGILWELFKKTCPLFGELYSFSFLIFFLWGKSNIFAISNKHIKILWMDRSKNIEKIIT